MSAQADAVKAQNAAATAAAQARKEQQALDYFNAMDNYYLRQYSDQQNKTLTDQIQKDQFKEALKVSDMKRDAQLRAFDLSEERYRDQLQVNQAEFKRAKGDLESQFESTLIGYQTQLEDQDRAFNQEQFKASFERDRINRSKARLESQFGADGTGGTQQRSDQLSIDRAKDAIARRDAIRADETTRQTAFKAADDADITAQKNEITNARTQKDLVLTAQKAAARIEDARALLNRDSQLANIAFQKQGQRIETLARVGQAKARGRQGKSAERTLQTTLALSGINVARLTSQAYYAKEDYNKASSLITERVNILNYQDAIAKLRESTATSQLNQRQKRVTAQDKFDTDVRAVEATFDKNEKEIRLVEQKSLLADIAKNQFTDDTAEADAQLDEIAFAIGLSKEQLTMNKERLGKSLVSSVKSIDSQLLNLQQSKFKADYNAHAARMLPPEFAADAKAPYDVPLPKYIEPRPGAAPTPPYQAQYIPPPTQSGLSQALMIGGAALSVAAIPFTMGASIGAAGAASAGAASAAAAAAAPAGLSLGMNVGTAAAIGTGLAGVGTGLTQFSQMPFMYN